MVCLFSSFECFVNTHELTFGQINVEYGYLIQKTEYIKKFDILVCPGLRSWFIFNDFETGLRTVTNLFSDFTHNKTLKFYVYLLHLFCASLLSRIKVLISSSQSKTHLKFSIFCVKLPPSAGFCYYGNSSITCRLSNRMMSPTILSATRGQHCILTSYTGEDSDAWVEIRFFPHLFYL